MDFDGGMDRDRKIEMDWIDGGMDWDRMIGMEWMEINWMDGWVGGDGMRDFDGGIEWLGWIG